MLMDKKSENIKVLLSEIKDKIGKPVSSRVVAATIESFGIRDIDTKTDYGAESIQDLAQYVYNQLTQQEEHKDSLNLSEKRSKENQPQQISISDYLWVKVKTFAHYYPLGIFHLLPVVLQIACIIVFGYSLWTHVAFNALQSTAVVLGVIIGIVATGGFVQVIGRQVSFFHNYEDFAMAKTTINYIQKTGIYTLLALFIFIFSTNIFFHLYPYLFLLIVLMYAFLSGVLLLMIAPLHTIKQRWMITLSITTGTITTIFLNEFTILKIYFTHFIGITVAIIIARLYIVYYFKKIIKSKDNDSVIDIKLTVFLYQNYRYFLYGFFVYFFIFIDRILAWSSTNNKPLPYIVFFEKNYELGMDLAILVFLLLAGVLEYAIASFTKFLDIIQKNTAFNEGKKFSKELFLMYWQSIFWLLLTALAIFFFIYLIITQPWGYKGQFKEDLLSLSVKVSFIGGIGYLLLAWGMLNTLYLFTLGKPNDSLRAIIYACIINFFTGFLLSRFISFEYSVYGMLVGALVFQLMTMKAVFNFFKNLDYHYYASY